MQSWLELAQSGTYVGEDDIVRFEDLDRRAEHSVRGAKHLGLARRDARNG